MRILLVEDDPDLAAGIKRALKQAGHAVDLLDDGADADTVLATDGFDALVLDLGLPGLDGIEVLRRLRRRGSAMPVLILTARASLDDRLKGLDLGADDYLVKPFALAELEARLRALLRRSQGATGTVLRYGRLALDVAARQVTVDGEPVALLRRELAVLEILLGRAGWVVGKSQIARHLFGYDDEAGPNAIEIYVHRLRRKLDHAGVTIRTVRGLGYMIEAAPEASEPSQESSAQDASAQDASAEPTPAPPSDRPA